MTNSQNLLPGLPHPNEIKEDPRTYNQPLLGIDIPAVYIA